VESCLALLAPEGLLLGHGPSGIGSEADRYRALDPVAVDALDEPLHDGTCASAGNACHHDAEASSNEPALSPWICSLTRRSISPAGTDGAGQVFQPRFWAWLQT
jgi:hypothetical protein